MPTPFQRSETFKIKIRLQFCDGGTGTFNVPMIFVFYWEMFYVFVFLFSFYRGNIIHSEFQIYLKKKKIIRHGRRR